MGNSGVVSASAVSARQIGAHQAESADLPLGPRSSGTRILPSCNDGANCRTQKIRNEATWKQYFTKRINNSKTINQMRQKVNYNRILKINTPVQVSVIGSPLRAALPASFRRPVSMTRLLSPGGAMRHTKAQSRPQPLPCRSTVPSPISSRPRPGPRML